jgi:hypothetical protein
MAHEFEVAICSIFRNEAPYLREWIEFHRLVGVEHFYLYNNCSNDNFEEVLAPYVQEGIVELIDWSFEPKTRQDWLKIQRKAYHDGAGRALGKTKWLAIIDSDEFIFPVKDKTIQRFLQDFEKEASVGINWQNFGTSHIPKLDPEKLMIEQLIFRGNRNLAINGQIKSITKPECIDLSPDGPKTFCKNGWNPHRPKLKKGCQLVDVRHKVLEGYSNPDQPVNRIRIHHYATRDEATFQAKLQKPNQGPDRIKRLKQRAKQMNKVKDKSILVFAKELREALGIADPAAPQ